MDRDKLVHRYTALALQYIRIPNGVGWKPEYEELKQNLKAEMNQIREQLDMPQIGEET